MGLKVGERHTCRQDEDSFNPAEARYGFKSRITNTGNGLARIIVSIQPKPDMGLKVLSEPFKGVYRKVSIQPKPDNGLKAADAPEAAKVVDCFNPAEARQWFKRYFPSS